MPRPSLVTRLTERGRDLPLPAPIFYGALLLVAMMYSILARSIAGVLPVGLWTPAMHTRCSVVPG